MDERKQLTPGRNLTENELELLRAILEIFDAGEAGQKTIYAQKEKK